MKHRRSRRAALAAVAACLLAAGADAATPLDYSLLKDLETSVGRQSSIPGDFVAWNGRLWFSADTRDTGRELFATDGSAGGTRVALDLVPGPASSGARPLGVAGGRLVLEADDGLTGPQLWVWDGEGTPPERITSLVSGNPAFRRIETAGGRLILQSQVGGPFWTTDGTAAGTRSLLDALPGYQLYYSYTVQPACTVGGVATFPARDSANAARLVRSDGTVAGTQVIAQLDQGFTPATSIIDQRLMNGECHYLVGEVHGPDDGAWRWWATDGSASSARLVSFGTGAKPLGLVGAGGASYLAQATDGRLQLLRNLPGSDVVETTLDLLGATGASRPVSIAGRIAFVADYEPDGQMRSGGIFLGDGTTAGTTRIYPIDAAQPTLAVERPVVVNSAMILQGSGIGLRVDGVTGQVTPAPDLDTLDLSRTVALGTLQIGPGNDAGGLEPWASDGSLDGTHRIADLRAATADGLDRSAGSGELSRQSTANGDRLYFLSGAGSGRILWGTDGSAAGTRRLPATLLRPLGVPTQPVAVTDGVVFVDTRSVSGQASRVMRASPQLDAVTPLSALLDDVPRPLWTGSRVIYTSYSDLYGSDGQSQGQVIFPVFSNLPSLPIGRIGGAAVFFGGSADGFGGADRGVWRSDGTAPGTFRLFEDSVRPYDEASSAVFQGKLHFVACLPGTGCALVATDGTPAGTATIRTLPDDGGYPVRPGAFAVAGDRLVFLVDGWQLWSSDGTPGGTDLLGVLPGASTVSRLAAAGGHAHLAFECSSQCKAAYLVTDGTGAGTRYVDAPAGLVPTATVMAPVGGETVAFSCRSAGTGEELCVADADGSHLRLLADTNPGPAGSSPRLLGVTANAVYVAADDGAHGYEPWRLAPRSDRIFASGFEPAAD